MGRESDLSEIRKRMFERTVEGIVYVNGEPDRETYWTVREMPGFEDFSIYTGAEGDNGYLVTGCACKSKRAIVEVGMQTREVGDQGDLTEEAIGTMSIPGVSFRISRAFRRDAQWTICIKEDRPGSRTGFSKRLRNSFPLGYRSGKWCPENGVPRGFLYFYEIAFLFWDWALAQFMAHIQMPTREEILRYR